MIEEVNQEATEITLKALREAASLTQEDLARRLNRSFRTVSDWETGKGVPRFDNAIMLAIELGISLKALAKAMRLDVTRLPDDICPCRDSVEVD